MTKITLASEDLKSTEARRAALAELVATFSFVFLGVGAVVASGRILGVDGLTPARLMVIALAHGLAIAIFVAASARFSGGHLNPAVTVAAVVTGKISVTRGGMYVVAQVAGGILAAFLLKGIFPDALEGGLGAHGLGAVDGAGIGLLVEVLLTFFLVFVVFATAMDPRGMGHLAPFAIGVAVLLDHLVGVPLTGASMNPARTLGPAWASGAWADHWIYWVGPIAGGIIAALVYQHLFLPREERA